MSSKSRLKKLVLPSRVNKKEVENVALKETVKAIIQKPIQTEEEVYECPLCFEKLKGPFPHPLQRLIKAVKKNEEEYKKEQEEKYEILVKQCKEEGTMKPPFNYLKAGISKNDQQMICRMHKVELVMKPLGIKKGYPTQIDFESIDNRINEFKQELIDIVDSKAVSLFLSNVLKVYEEVGSMKARQTTSVMKRFEETLPGYYGNRGSHYIMESLNQIFLKSDYLSKAKSSPLTPIEYIQQVLVPECGIRLIKQDLNLKSLEEACEVMKESTEYGSIVYNKIKKKKG